MLNNSQMLQDGLKVLIHRHEKMQRLGRPHEPSVVAIMELSCRLADAPKDAILVAQAWQLLNKHEITGQLVHAANCRDLFSSGLVEEALNYCKAQKIAPPKCPLEVECPSDRAAQNLAEEILADPKWWKQKLKDLDRASEARKKDI